MELISISLEKKIKLDFLNEKKRTKEKKGFCSIEIVKKNVTLKTIVNLRF